MRSVARQILPVCALLAIGTWVFAQSGANILPASFVAGGITLNPIQFPDGTAALPSMTFSGQTDMGFSRVGTNTLAYSSTSGTRAWTSGGSTFKLISGYSLGWVSSATDGSGTIDTVFQRAAAGEVILGDAATIVNNATLRYRSQAEANTGTKTVGAAESGESYNNVGDGDGSIVNLPDNPVAGFKTRVYLVAAQTITVNTGTGETIWLAGTSCGTDIAGSDTGASLDIEAVSGGSGAVWHAIGSGTWTC